MVIPFVGPPRMDRMAHCQGEEFIGKRQYDLATECLTQGLQALDNKGDDSGNESQKATWPPWAPVSPLKGFITP